MKKTSLYGGASIASLFSAGLTGPMLLERKDASDTPTPEIKKALDGLMETNKKFQDSVTAELKELREKGVTDPITAAAVKRLNDQLDLQQKHIDALRLKEARPMIRGADGEKREATEVELKHRAAVHDYIRKGNSAGYEAEELKALSVGSDPEGGYTVTPEMDRQISRVVSEVSAIRSVANVVSIGSSAYKRLINVGGTDSGWVGESESRPQTNNAMLRERTYPTMEIYANPAITQTLLDDSNFDVEAWLADEVQIEFAEEEGSAFIMGDGVAKPRGFIGGYTPVANTSFTEAGGSPGYVFTGVNGAFKSAAAGDGENNIIDLIYALKAPYRSNARLVTNRATLALVRKMRDANGLSFWSPSLQAGQPSTVLGYPVLEAEDMPVPATDSFSMAFGDFNRGYQVVDRLSTRILRDPYTAKPFVLFYTTKRVGGGIRMAEAIKLLKFGTS